MQIPILARYLSASLLWALLLGSCTTTTTFEVTSPPTASPPTSKPFTLPQDGSFSYHLFDVVPSYTFVGAIKNYEHDSLIGTGVLISPDVVLSAAHVVDATSMHNLEWVEVDGKTSCIKKIVYYSSLLDNKWHDIAILFLESRSDKVPCIMFDNDTDFVYKHMPLTTVGHGHGLRRNSNPGIFRYYGRLVLSPRFMIMLPLRDTVWHGDSGGAILTDDNKLIGIVSHYVSTKDGRIFENVGSSIEYYREWIESHVPTLSD